MLSNDDYSKAFHEIKNTVTLISSSLQLLEHKHPEVKDYSYWTDSLQSLKYLREMVTELSQTRLSEFVELKPLNLNLLLNDIITSIRSLNWDRSFRFETDIQPDLPFINGDSLRLTQAIINLIKNAYESMEKNGVCRLNVYLCSGMINIDVIDYGGGIDPEYAKRLFQPFVTSKSNGTGLGLIITRQIAENHHGFLTYESRPNDGCTFRLSLPTT